MNHPTKSLILSLSMAMLAVSIPPSDDAAAAPGAEGMQVAGEPELNATIPLGADEFSLRRRSTMDLWRDRERYRESILAAAHSNDLEAAERARWILGRWRRGILAETPPDLAQELSTLTPVQAIERLLEAGQFAAAAIAVQESQRMLDFETVMEQVAITLGQRFPIYARAAVRSQRTAEFFDFLDAASSTPFIAVSRRDWAQLFATDASPVDPTQLPAAAAAWDSDLALRTQVLLDLLAEDTDAAMAAARRADEAHLSRTVDPNQPSDAAWATLIEHRQRSLVRSVRMLTLQWSAIANAASESARQWEQEALQMTDATGDQRDVNSDSPATANMPAKLAHAYEVSVRQWSDALIAADRCGDEDIRADAVAGLAANLNALGHGDEISESTAEARSLAWRTLVMHGEIDAGLAIVGDDDPTAAAAIAANASRHAEAFERLGYPAEQIDTHLESWIDEAIAAQRKVFAAADDPSAIADASARATGIAPEIDKLFTLIRLLDGVNQDEAAWRIADRLSLPDLQIQRPQSSTAYLVRDYLLLSLLSTRHSDWMIQLAMRDWETESTIISRNTISQITVTDSYEILSVLQRFVQLRRPQMTAIQAFRVACEIARADDVDRREHAELVSELAQSLDDNTLRHRLADEPELQMLFRPTVDVWSDLFAAHGRPDLAEPLLRRRSSSGDIKATLTLAKEYRLSGPLTASRDLDQEIWDAVAMSTRDGNARFRNDVITAVEAVGEQWRAARDLGDQRTAERLLLQLRAMACTPSTDMRQQIANVLAELGQWEIADEIYRSLLVITALTNEESQTMFEIARKYQGFVVNATASQLETTTSTFDRTSISELSSEDLELRRQAIQWVDLAFVETLDHVNLRPHFYLIFPRLFAREQLELLTRHAVDNPSEATYRSIRRRIDRLQQFNSMDITTAESIFPTLRELGLGDLVAAELKRMIAAADTHLRTFPADAVIANNVAWGAAVNDSEFDSALRLSRHAVRFEPDSAIYRDTLAEILAREGNFEEALQIERGCVIDDPGQWHLHEQVKRFQKKLSKSR